MPIFVDLYYPGEVATALDIPHLPQVFTESTMDAKSNKMETTEPICRFLIQPKLITGSYRGEFVSPAYPGFHIHGLKCIYALRGQPNQRIRIEIVDLSLPSHLNT